MRARMFTEALFKGNWKGPKSPGSINYGADIQWTTLQLRKHEELDLTVPGTQ